MKQIRAVIIDDEPLARENMRDLLAAHPEVTIVGEAGTVDEAREVLIKMQPDAVFLDIRMPGGTGFDVLSGLDRPLQVVFVTAYDEFAIRAFQVNAIDYLLKPIDRRLLAGAVRKLMANSALPFDARVDENAQSLPFRLDDDILINERDKYFFISLQTVCAIRACGNYTEAIDIQNRTHLFRRSLSTWCNRLPTPPFVRLDRSLIINGVHGLRVEIMFQNGNFTFDLGRAASGRFRKFIKDKVLPMKEKHPTRAETNTT
jgi:two-component system LytT family response regulator